MTKIHLQWGQWHTSLISALKMEGLRSAYATWGDPVSNVNFKSGSLTSHSPNISFDEAQCSGALDSNLTTRKKGFEESAGTMAR